MKEAGGFSPLSEAANGTPSNFPSLSCVGDVPCCVSFLVWVLATEIHALFQFTSVFLEIYPACQFWSVKKTVEWESVY